MDRMLRNARNDLSAAQWLLRMERKIGNDPKAVACAERAVCVALDRLWAVQQLTS